MFVVAVEVEKNAVCTKATKDSFFIFTFKMPWDAENANTPPYQTGTKWSAITDLVRKLTCAILDTPRT